MMPWLLLGLAGLQATPPAEPATVGEEVVVVATRERCGIAIANRILSSREFDKRSADWARGVPVRVAVPAGADHRCLAKIMFKLADKGVTRAEFVDR